MKPKLFLTLSLSLILSLLSFGSASSQGNPAVPLRANLFQEVPTETPFPFSKTLFEDVGPYTFIMECNGEGEPTIILENSVAYESWVSLNPFQPISRTCKYKRAGVGGIDKITTVRTVGDQVQDLHTLLTKGGVPGPYVLVGHGTAGFNLVLYASQYPEDVAGLVCVDCYTPQLNQNLLKALGEKYNDLWDASDDLRYSLKWQIESLSGQNVERVDFLASETQIAQVTSLGDIPFIVLVAGKPLDVLDVHLALGDESWLGLDAASAQVFPVDPDVDFPLASENIISISGSLGDLYYIALIKGYDTVITDIYTAFGLDKIHYAQSETFSKLSNRGRVETYPDLDELDLISSAEVTNAAQEIVEIARQAP